MYCLTVYSLEFSSRLPCVTGHGCKIPALFALTAFLLIAAPFWCVCESRFGLVLVLVLGLGLSFGNVGFEIVPFWPISSSFASEKQITNEHITSRTEHKTLDTHMPLYGLNTIEQCSPLFNLLVFSSWLACGTTGLCGEISASFWPLAAPFCWADTTRFELVLGMGPSFFVEFDPSPQFWAISLWFASEKSNDECTRREMRHEAQNTHTKSEHFRVIVFYRSVFGVCYNPAFWTFSVHRWFQFVKQFVPHRNSMKIGSLHSGLTHVAVLRFLLFQTFFTICRWLVETNHYSIVNNL